MLDVAIVNYCFPFESQVDDLTDQLDGLGIGYEFSQALNGDVKKILTPDVTYHFISLEDKAPATPISADRVFILGNLYHSYMHEEGYTPMSKTDRKHIDSWVQMETEPMHLAVENRIYLSRFQKPLDMDEQDALRELQIKVYFEADTIEAAVHKRYLSDGDRVPIRWYQTKEEAHTYLHGHLRQEIENAKNQVLHAEKKLSKYESSHPQRIDG